MKRTAILSLGLCLSLICGRLLAANIEATSGSFTDAARNREIPYKVYYPSPLTKQYPIIIFSHGLGGSRDGYALLGMHLASNGFVVIHVQHAGSDEALYENPRDLRAVQAAVRKSLDDPANAVNRFLDIPFVIAQLPKLQESDEKLKGHLNVRSIGMAGHSYGAISTMVAAGERMGDGYQSFKVPAIGAGLSLSPSPPRPGLDPARAYGDIKIPIFHITGTDDVNLVEGRDIKAKDRLVPYRSLSSPNQYLLVLDKADHTTFSGRRIGGAMEKKLDKQHMGTVLNGAVAFFQAYLMGNKSAEKWLREGYPKSLEAGDVFESK